jgi:hypothetical protein
MPRSWKCANDQFKIHYPVAQDNDYNTWTAYNNQYWPAHYLIDVNGEIRQVHFGEGAYEETEHAIQQLLQEAGQQPAEGTLNVTSDLPTSGESISAETYIGSARMQFYYPSRSLQTGTQSLVEESSPPINSFSLGGTWSIGDQFSSTTNNSTLVYNFVAKKVFLVLHPPEGKSAQLKVFLDGKPISSSVSGADVVDGVVTVDAPRLYNLVDLKNSTENHILRLEFQTPNTEVFAFTFG